MYINVNSCTIHNSESPFSWLEQNYTVGYPSNRALSNPKKNKVLTHAALWINLRLKKARHQKITDCRIPFIYPKKTNPEKKIDY